MGHDRYDYEPFDTILTEGRNLDFHGMEKIEKESLLMWHNSLNDFAMIISAS